jgi:argininosuccinate synthase
VTDFIWPTLKAGAKYEGEYLLGTSFARPLIGRKLAEIALAEGADALEKAMTKSGSNWPSMASHL